MQLQPIIAGLAAIEPTKEVFRVPAARLRLVSLPEGFKVHAPQFPLGLVLHEVGKASICRTLKMSQKYFEDYPMPEEFTEHVAALLREMGENELLVRVTGGTVMAVLLPSFQILDDLAILQELATVFDSLHITPDVEVTSSDVASEYRFRLGTTRRVLRVRNTELGVGNLHVSLGLRFQNGYLFSRLPSMGTMAWSHRGSDPRVIESARLRMRAALSEGDEKWTLFEASLEEKRGIFLGAPTVDIIDWMVKNDVMNASFAKVVMADIAQGPDPIPTDTARGLSWHEFVMYLSKLAFLQPGIDARYKLESAPFYLAMKHVPW